MKPQTQPKYPTEVIAIHNEFDNAGEALLQEANTILAELSKKPLEKGATLHKIGFRRTKEAVETKQALEEKQHREETARMVEHYMVTYPTKKFITESVVKAICEKYHLVFGSASRYKGFVPEKNLKEMTEFKVHKNDIQHYKINGGPNTPCTLEEYEAGIKTEYPSLFKADRFLKICAPKKDMDMTGMTVQGYRVVKVIPDPVILQPVKGGYIIVTKWGDEASDPLIINEQDN